MTIVIDTHTLYWFLTADKRLSKKAKALIEESNKIFIPTIILLELLYLFHKKKQIEHFYVTMNLLKKSRKYSILSLDLTIVEEVIKVYKKFEIHDAVIVATSQLISVSIITKDRAIRKFYKATIW